ncbi:MAG TPA: hypothetical protein VND93_20245 [Myxococcales bacterium]|nr:hypothetical protein [Myxococcales bacterium]
MSRYAIPGLVAALALLVVLAGCNDPRDCGGVSGGAGWLMTASGYPVLTGDVTVEVPPAQFTLCPPGFAYPRATAVHVFDPADQPVAATFEQVNGRRIWATFHSDVPGPHRVEVDYTPDPKTGRAVTTTAAMAYLILDRSDATRLELAAQCDTLRRTAAGTWLCDNEVFRGTTRVQTLRTDMTYVVSGNTVWGVSEGPKSPFGAVLGPHDVARWTDTGTGPLADAGTGTFDAGYEASAVHSIAATRDELVVQFDRRLTQLGWTAGPTPSLRVVGQSDTQQPSNVTAEMTWEPPLITLSVYSSQPDAGSGLCLYTLDAGTVVPAGGCLSNPFKKTADGYWSPGNQEWVLDAIQGGTWRRVATFSFTQWSTIYKDTSGDPDRPGHMAVIPKVQPGGPVFEGYWSGPNQSFRWERDYAWWPDQLDGGTEVVLR